MAKGDWWFKFDIKSWRNSPELRCCSLQARGFWIDCIAIMRHSGQATLTDTIENLSRSIGCLPSETEACIEELKRNKTADVTLRNDRVTLKSRMYAKELRAKELSNLRVKKHREKQDVTPEKRLSVISNKKEVIKEEEIREVAEAAPPPKKGTRLPEQFFITAELREWAGKKKPTVDLALETEKFCNYFRAAPGQKGVKLDWSLTWKNWILNSNGSRQPEPSVRATAGKTSTCSMCGNKGCLGDELGREVCWGNDAGLAA